MRIFIIVAIFFNTLLCFAQSPPTIQWQKVPLTGLHDRATDITSSGDGGYLYIGVDNMDPSSLPNCTLTKIDAFGNQIWTKTIGGSQFDYGRRIYKLSDGNFMIIGNTTSIDGDMVGHTVNEKIWMFKVDISGNIIMKKFYNGESCNEMLELTDGYVLTGGKIQSGNMDVLVLKTSLNGAVVWSKTFGGTSEDIGYKTIATPTNNLLVFSQTLSNDGNITQNHGTQDVWLLELDAMGNLNWQKTIGGTSYEYARDVIAESDGYVFWGKTASSDGDLTGLTPHSQGDAWLFKTDFNGNIIWQKTYGSNYGENIEEARLLKTIDNNYIAIVQTGNGGGDVVGSNYHGSTDIWMLKFDLLGNIIWKRCWGGNSFERSMSFLQNTDGSILVVGSTQSQNGDLIGSGKNTANQDVWIFKLNSEVLAIEELHGASQKIDIYPNPTSEIINIKSPFKILKTEVYNITGQLQDICYMNTLNISKYPTGIYILKVYTDKNVSTFKVLKN